MPGYIPPADATRSIERTNKLSCFKGSEKQNDGGEPARVSDTVAGSFVVHGGC